MDTSGREVSYPPLSAEGEVILVGFSLLASTTAVSRLPLEIAGPRGLNAPKTARTSLVG